jgi:hypothetical protein
MLKRFAGDWPIKEYLKTHFNNQRQYWRKVVMCTGFENPYGLGVWVSRVRVRVEIF